MTPRLLSLFVHVTRARARKPALLVALLACLASLTCMAPLASAAPPGLMNYQARLTDPSGHPLTTSPVTLTFTFWDSPLDGNQLGNGFSDTDIVTPDSRGIVSTQIGDDVAGQGIPLSVFDPALDPTGTGIWLNVNVAGTDIVPRTAVAEAISALGAFTLNGEACIIPAMHSTPSSNMVALINAYYAAAYMTPHGKPLGPDNRITILLPPGQYNSGFLGPMGFTVFLDYVDIVGMSSARENQYFFSILGNVFTAFPVDARIENLTLDCTVSTGALNTDPTDHAAYYTDLGPSDTLTIRNCEFKSNENFAWTMRLGIDYAGTYENCKAGTRAFGGPGIASGTFTNCTAGDFSFGSGPTSPMGIASGTFTNCTAGVNSFGESLASGIFTDCSGGDTSFGGFNGASTGNFTRCSGGGVTFGLNCFGTYVECTGGDNAFGGFFGLAQGTFVDCKGTTGTFGGNNGSASGQFTNCIGGPLSFGGGGGDATGGRFFYCTAPNDAFTTAGIPTIRYCVKGGADYSYPP